MIAANENGQYGRHQLAAVVLVERAHVVELLRYGHAVQVAGVAGGLEITAAQQQVDLAAVRLQRTDGGVDFLQLPVGAALDGDAHVG